MTNNTKYTYCLCNGQPKQMSIFDLFDWRKYDIFKGVTYSASKQFILKYLFYYRQLDLIMGLPNYEAQKAIQDTFENLNNYYKLAYKTPLNTDIKHDYLVAELHILGRGVAHSKIYLLSNSQTQAKRVIISSANLSLAALSTTKDQFEEIQVFDDPAKYNLYLKCYQEILCNTTGYMDRETKNYLRRLGYFKNN